MSLGRVGIVVAARSGSQRLPGKALLSLRGIPMLAFLLGRLRPARRATLYLATTDLPADDALEGIAIRPGCLYFAEPMRTWSRAMWPPRSDSLWTRLFG